MRTWLAKWLGIDTIIDVLHCHNKGMESLERLEASNRELQRVVADLQKQIDLI